MVSPRPSASSKATGAQVHSQLLNVAEREAVLEYAQTVADHFGGVNAVFNNAGIAHHGEMAHMEFRTSTASWTSTSGGVVERHEGLPAASSPPAMVTS